MFRILIACSSVRRWPSVFLIALGLVVGTAMVTVQGLEPIRRSQPSPPRVTRRAPALQQAPAPSTAPRTLNLDALPDVTLAIEPDAETDVTADEPNDEPNDELRETDAGEDRPVVPLEADTDAELLALRDKVRSCLAHYYQRRISAAEKSPWAVMHALIAYGVDTQIEAGGRPVNAIGWLCWNGSCRGQQLFFLKDGKLQARTGPGVQGHEGQFLAMLAQCKVKADYPLKVEGRDFTVADLVEYEKSTCKPGTELTFKLIGLSHYLPSEATWENSHGKWSIERLIQEELKQPVVGAACGGTHRMMGFSYSLYRRQKEGKPLEGQWARARQFVDDYHEYTFRLQNPDGSFSTKWFAGREARPDLGRRLETTGHILEWLVFSLPPEQLSDPRVTRAVDYLATVLLEGRSRQWEIGPLGHALHALVIYDERVFGNQPGKRDYVLLQESGKASRD